MFFCNTMGVRPFEIDGHLYDGSVRNLGLRLPLNVGYDFDVLDNLTIGLFTGPWLNFNITAREHTLPDFEGPEPTSSANLFDRGWKRFDLQWGFGLKVRFAGHYYVGLSGGLGLTPLAFVAVLTRSSCPILPMMQSTLPNTPRTSILLLPQPRQSVAPLETSSPSCKRFPHRLCVAVKFGVCVCECGKVTALNTSAVHRFASCAAMRGFQPLCFAPMVFRTATSSTCTTLCLFHNQGCGSAVLKQVWHCAHLALDFDNGYVFRHD